MKGILIDNNFKLIVLPKYDTEGKIVSGLLIGESSDQTAAVLLKLTQGDVKEDPLIGPGLTRFIRSKYSASKIEQLIKAHFRRVGLDYTEYKENINFTINGNAL